MFCISLHFHQKNNSPILYPFIMFQLIFIVFSEFNQIRWNYLLTWYPHLQSSSIYCEIIVNQAILIFIFTTVIVRIKGIRCKMLVCAPLWWHCASEQEMSHSFSNQLKVLTSIANSKNIGMNSKASSTHFIESQKIISCLIPPFSKC